MTATKIKPRKNRGKNKITHNESLHGIGGKLPRLHMSSSVSPKNREIKLTSVD
jgi:hypothetical protein